MHFEHDMFQTKQRETEGKREREREREREKEINRKASSVKSVTVRRMTTETLSIGIYIILVISPVILLSVVYQCFCSHSTEIWKD